MGYCGASFQVLNTFLADIVTEIEDTEVCPGDNIIDKTLFTYQAISTKQPEVQQTTMKPKTEPEPKTTKILETVEPTKKTEESKENEDEKIPEDYVEPNEEQENEEKEVTDVIENVPTTTTKTAVTTTTMPSEMPDTTITTHRKRDLSLASNWSKYNQCISSFRNFLYLDSKPRLTSISNEDLLSALLLCHQNPRLIIASTNNTTIMKQIKIYSIVPKPSRKHWFKSNGRNLFGRFFRVLF